VCAIEYYTYDDYVSWEGDWELINGIAIARHGSVAMAPAPMRKHQNIAGRILTQLNNQIEECERCEALMEEDWKIGFDTVLRPDVVLVCDEQNDSYLTKTPEIIVEVISKSTAKKDEKYKFEIYEKEKVNYYVIVYPDELIAKIYKLENGKFEKQGDFYNQAFLFENTTCKPKLDFEQLFKKFKKQ